MLRTGCVAHSVQGWDKRGAQWVSLEKNRPTTVLCKHADRGQRAEDQALAYLRAIGLRLLARNYRTPGQGAVRSTSSCARPMARWCLSKCAVVSGGTGAVPGQHWRHQAKAAGCLPRATTACVGGAPVPLRRGAAGACRSPGSGRVRRSNPAWQWAPQNLLKLITARSLLHQRLCKRF